MIINFKKWVYMGMGSFFSLKFKKVVHKGCKTHYSINKFSNQTLNDQNRQMPQYNSNFVNGSHDVTCNEVLITIVNLCDKRVSVCHGCNGPVKTNGLPFPPP